jgi:hypothetical protein
VFRRASWKVEIEWRLHEVEEASQRKENSSCQVEKGLIRSFPCNMTESRMHEVKFWLGSKGCHGIWGHCLSIIQTFATAGSWTSMDGMNGMSWHDFISHGKWSYDLPIWRYTTVAPSCSASLLVFLAFSH